MNSKVLIASAVSLFTIAISSCVFAATGTVDFKSSVNQAKKGDKFTVTLSAQSEDGINGVDTKYTYNTDKLELVSGTLADSTKWTSLSSGQDITIISNSEQSIKSANIYVLTFKVKDNVAVGDVLKVETNEILLDTDAQDNSEVNIGAKKAEVTVIETQVEEPKQDEPTTQEEPGTKTDEPAKQEEPSTKTDEPTKQEEQGTKTDEPTKEETSNKVDEPAKQEDTSKKSDNNTKKSNEINEKLIKTITTEDNKSEEKVATKALPKTGVSYIVVAASVLAAIVLGIFFYKKDKSIKLQ